jgi:colanic acid/amylovoran biosynthesis glycosyltransferase
MLNQITGLIDRGHNVTIFAYTKGDCLKVQDDVIKYNLLEKTIYKDFPSNLDQYDIVVFQLGHKAIDIKKTHNFKGKVVICLRGYDITGFLKENPHWYDEYFTTCDLFLPVCESFKSILESIGCSPEKIIVHHSAIDCSRFAFRQKAFPKDGVIKIISAGRFIEKKGFEYAIRAVEKLVRKYPKLEYTIIGNGILKESYIELIKRLKVEKNIKIQNWYSHEEYIKILSGADIFVLSSVTAQNNDQEGIPNVLKEAMAIGLVVVATNHSGNSELIKNKEYGFLVPERSKNVIYRAIDYIISNPGLLLPMQIAARKKIEAKFNKEKENDRLEKILLYLLNE